jgi:ElaB/YqjD/DUF883 family membrane-anchored ribosome-binding protein
MTHPQTSADDAFESGRRFAGQAMERANERARELRAGMSGLAQRGLHTVADGASAAQRQLGNYAQATTRYVAEQPLKSALIAAAIGAAVAGLVLALRHRRDSSSTFY